MRLGIDFGTTRTVIAASRGGNYPVVSFETDDGFADFLPGLAHQTGEELEFGWKAADRQAENLRKTANLGPDSNLPPSSQKGKSEDSTLLRSVKSAISFLAPDEELNSSGFTGRTALALATDYLCHVREMLLHHSNLDISPDEPLEAMVAVPAHASTRQRYLTLEAFSRAGFQVLGMVNEPTAAAIEYAYHSSIALSSRSPKKYVLVYDLGGGTFDAAAVSLIGRRFELIDADGIAHLGGQDIDQALAELVCESTNNDFLKLDYNFRTALLERARTAKEALTPRTRKLLVDTSNIFEQEEVLIDAEELYKKTSSLVERSLITMDRLLGELKTFGIDPENSRELGAVYLVGGSAQYPQVQRMLRERFGRKIQLAPQPHASTALGLAIAADDTAGVFVREAPTRHFGVWRESEGGLEKVFDPIIEKSHWDRPTQPLRIERSYRPAHVVGRLRFIECTRLDSRRQPTGEVTPWQSVLFPYDPALLDESDLESHSGERSDGELNEEIVETYEYTDSGLIRVAIENRTSGYRREFVLGQPNH